MNPDVISDINNIYQLVAWGLFIVAFIVAAIIVKKDQKKQQKELVKTLAKNNLLIVQRLEELKVINNSLNLQSSMDVIENVYRESMYCIAKFLIQTIIYNNLQDADRQKEIRIKLKNIIKTAYESDKMILSRIYYKNKPLSSRMEDKYINTLYENLLKNLFLINDSNRIVKRRDMIDELESKFKHFIQLSQNKLSV